MQKISHYNSQLQKEVSTSILLSAHTATKHECTVTGIVECTTAMPTCHHIAAHPSSIATFCPDSNHQHCLWHTAICFPHQQASETHCWQYLGSRRWGALLS